MELDAGAEEHTKQYPQDDGIWKNAPVERQIHEESIRAMKITMAEVNAKSQPWHWRPSRSPKPNSKPAESSTAPIEALHGQCSNGAPWVNMHPARVRAFKILCLSTVVN